LLPTTLLMPEKPPARPPLMLVAAPVARVTHTTPPYPTYHIMLHVPPATVPDCEPVVMSNVPAPASARFSNAEYGVPPLVPLLAPLIVHLALSLHDALPILLLPTTLLMPEKPPARPPLMLVAAPVA